MTSMKISHTKFQSFHSEVVKALTELDKFEKKVNAAGKMVTWHAVSLSADMVKAISSGELSFEDARAQIAEPQGKDDSAIKTLAVPHLPTPLPILLGCSTAWIKAQAKWPAVFGYGVIHRLNYQLTPERRRLQRGLIALGRGDGEFYWSLTIYLVRSRVLFRNVSFRL